MVPYRPAGVSVESPYTGHISYIHTIYVNLG
jgi:hypothetical protein